MKNDSSSAMVVPRSSVFVTVDGLFVVHWEEHRVQDLLSGRYLPYHADQFDAPMTDWELNQLRNCGVVERFDGEYVRLQRVPAVIPARSYYLYTRLAKHQLREVERALHEAGLGVRFAVRARDRFLVIRGEKGVSFSDYDSAEAARSLLAEHLPALFRDSVVAFSEVIKPS